MPRPSRPSASAVSIAALVACVSLFGVALPAGAEPRSVDYRPPLDAPVADPFRAPANPYGPGNRGIDYAASEGQQVVAAAAGEVVFVGPIAGSIHVVVLHADGVRTSYSFLASASVRRGQKVDAGQIVGIAGGAVHFGARAGEVYLDPADLFAGTGPAVRLVPLEPLSEAGEKQGLIKMLGGLLRRGAGAVAGAGVGLWNGLVRLTRSELARLIVEYVGGGLPYAVAMRVADAVLLAVAASKRPCTPDGVEPPPDPAPPVLVRVSGLMSDSAAIGKGGGIGGVDGAAIGAPGAPTYTFSYGDGGSWIEEGARYDGADTLAGFRESGAELAEGLARIRAAHPGRQIVIVAHSQGGLVAREALARTGGSGVSRLVTLATPHNGSDVATAGHLLSLNPGAAARAADLLRPFGLDPRSAAVHDLSEASSFLAGLGAPPPGVKVTSIAVAGDLLAPPPQAHLEGSDNRVIASKSFVGDHTGVNHNPEAHREVRLALAGLPAGCRPLLAHIRDHLRGELSSSMIDALAPILAAAASAFA